MRPMGEDESEPAQIVHARFSIDRDVLDLAQRNFSLLQNVIDRVGRQTGPMFDPAKTLLFSRGNQFAIKKQARRRIAVVSVKAQDFHPKKTENTGQKTVEAATIPQ